MNKFIFTSIILCLVTFCVHSQTAVLTLNSNVSSELSSGNKTYSARDAVRLQNGFRATNTTSNTLRIKTDHSIVPITPEYLSGAQIVDGTTRTLDKTNCIPGTIGGSINVGPSGAATYSLPISVSPGSHGMQPSLGVVYSSQSGNGELGYGWHLSGLSSITRVNQNQYYDNTIAPITLSANDKFMLDGQRLISKGANTYSPENNPYIQVVSDGTKFTVTSQDGVVTEYGGTTDSRFLAVNGTVPVTYSISKMTDPEGNYISYSYLGDNTTGEYRINEIKYTGNANTAPYNTVSFEYQKREDTNTAYIAGQALNQTILLTSVKVYAEGNLAYNYGFSYYYDGLFSKLNQVRLVANGNTYNPTVINWGKAPDYTKFQTSLGISNTVSYDISNISYQPTGDFNGDGLMETASYISSSLGPDASISVGFQNFLMSPFDVPILTGVKTGAGDRYRYIDFKSIDWDNDGKTDILVHYLYYKTDQNGELSGSYYHRVYKYSFNVSDPTLIYEATSSNSDLYQFCYADFDNNGVIDRITVCNSSVKEVYINGHEMSGNNLLQIQSSGLGLALVPVNFDGDGQTELLVLNRGGNAGSIYKLASGVFTKIFSDNNIFCPASNISIGDLNGDGKTDFVKYSSGIGWQTYYSTGTGFVIGNNMPFSNFNDPSSTPSCLLLTDVNHDGQSDMVYGFKNSYQIYLSKGKNFTPAVSTVTPCTNSDMSKINLTSLVNNNGQISIVYTENDKNRGYVTNFTDAVDSQHLLLNVTDGNNNISTITYTNYTDPSVQSTYPLRKLRSMPNIATNIQIKSEGKIRSNTTYTFGGGLLHLQGKGFLGFTDINCFESVSKVLIQSSFYFTVANNPDVYYTSLNTIRTYKNKILVSTKTADPPTAFCGGNLLNRQFIPLIMNSQIVDNLNNTTTTTTIQDFDFASGRPVKTLVTVSGVGGVFKTTSTSTYDLINNSTVSRINKLTIVKNMYNDTYSSETTNFYSSPTSLRRTALKLTLGSTNTTTSFSNFDSYGNPQTIDFIGTDGGSIRSRKEMYDTYGRFVVSNTDVNGYTSTSSYRSSDGALLSKTDINGLISSYTYSAGGNTLLETTKLPDGNVSVASSAWDDSGLCLMKTKVSITNGNTVTTWFNAAMKKVRMSSIGYKGNTVSTTYTYYPDGSLNSAASSGNTEILTYDSLGRILTDVGLNLNTSYSYSSNQIKVTDNILGIVKIQNTDALGNVQNTNGSTDGDVAYTYYASGKPRAIITGGKTTSMTYDDMGNQLTLSDPNKGLIRYTYDCFGELITQTDAKNQVITNTYSITGRRLTKKGANFSLSYTYSEENGSKGRIATITRDKVTESYSYDIYGRVIGIVTAGSAVPGGSVNSFKTTYSYSQSTGRLEKINYPTGLSVDYLYDGVGNLIQINNSATGGTIWSGNAKNDVDKWTQFTLGNGLITNYYYDANQMLNSITTGTTALPSSVQNLGYTFNSAGQLINRTDGSLTEAFRYDQMDRLISTQVGSRVKYVVDYQSDGNISNTTIGGGYHYDLASHPNAVSSVDGIANASSQSIPFLTNATYNIEDKVLTLDNGDIHADFIYGVDGNRFRMDNKIGGILQSSKIYIGDNEFGYNSSGALTYKRTIIKAPTGVCAVYEDNGNTQAFYYIHSDFQGSWLAISDGSGVVTNRYSYDAWGRPRKPQTWELYAAGTIPTSQDIGAMQPRFDRGYTGHEMLCSFGLINMNGRLYDPYLQRFLSPDPYIQAPGNAQNYNRYSYCLNNPLRYTDPTGQFFFTSLNTILGICGAIGSAAIDIVRLRFKNILSDMGNEFCSSWDQGVEMDMKLFRGNHSGNSSSGVSTQGGGDFGIFYVTDPYEQDKINDHLIPGFPMKMDPQVLNTTCFVTSLESLSVFYKSTRKANDFTLWALQHDEGLAAVTGVDGNQAKKISSNFFDYNTVSSSDEIISAIDKHHPVLTNIFVGYDYPNRLLTERVLVYHSIIVIGYNNNNNTYIIFDPTYGTYRRIPMSKAKHDDSNEYFFEVTGAKP